MRTRLLQGLAVLCLRVSAASVSSLLVCSSGLSPRCLRDISEPLLLFDAVADVAVQKFHSVQLPASGARLAMNEVVNSHLVAVSISAVLLFGNELLVHHLLVTQCIAIKNLESQG